MAVAFKNPIIDQVIFDTLQPNNDLLAISPYVKLTFEPKHENLRFTVIDIANPTKYKFYKLKDPTVEIPITSVELPEPLSSSSIFIPSIIPPGIPPPGIPPGTPSIPVPPPPPTLPKKIPFSITNNYQPQENQGCGRHALNNLFGMPNSNSNSGFFKKDNGVTINTSNMYNFTSNTASGLGLQNLCNFYEIITNNTKPGSCPDDEAYEFLIIQLALNLLGYEAILYKKDDKLKFINNNEDIDINNDNIVGFIGNTGNHYVAYRKEGQKYFKIDSVDVKGKYTPPSIKLKKIKQDNEVILKVRWNNGYIPINDNSFLSTMFTQIPLSGVLPLASAPASSLAPSLASALASPLVSASASAPAPPPPLTILHLENLPNWDKYDFNAYKTQINNIKLTGDKKWKLKTIDEDQKNIMTRRVTYNSNIDVKMNITPIIYRDKKPDGTDWNKGENPTDFINMITHKKYKNTLFLFPDSLDKYDSCEDGIGFANIRSYKATLQAWGLPIFTDKDYKVNAQTKFCDRNLHTVTDILNIVIDDILTIIKFRSHHKNYVKEIIYYGDDKKKYSNKTHPLPNKLTNIPAMKINMNNTTEVNNFYVLELYNIPGNLIDWQNINNISLLCELDINKISKAVDKKNYFINTKTYFQGGGGLLEETLSIKHITQNITKKNIELSEKKTKKNKNIKI